MTALDRSAGSGPVEESGPPGLEKAATYDPLRLCIFATVAALGWLLGPVALLGFAGLGFVGYWRARRGTQDIEVRAARHPAGAGVPGGSRGGCRVGNRELDSLRRRRHPYAGQGRPAQQGSSDPGRQGC